jgi:pimeloyl-ACP methyl ester carboxylesterase
LQGEKDVLTPPDLAREYFDDVLAPVKRMIFIREAGHFAAFTQPDQFLRELVSRGRPSAMDHQYLSTDLDRTESRPPVVVPI